METFFQNLFSKLGLIWTPLRSAVCVCVCVCVWSGARGGFLPGAPTPPKKIHQKVGRFPSKKRIVFFIYKKKIGISLLKLNRKFFTPLLKKWKNFITSKLKNFSFLLTEKFTNEE